MIVGARVEIVAGRLAGKLGTIAATYKEHGCGCVSVIVRVDGGGEWAGKSSEVRLA